MDIDTDAMENFYIYNNQEEFYHSGLLTEHLDLIALSRETPYSIIKSNKEAYFIVEKDSTYSSWSYFYCIPYNNIFYQFDQIKAAGLLIFAFSYVALFILTIYFANSITRPLTRLAGRMDKISRINFETSTFSLPLTLLKPCSMDSIHNLLDAAAAKLNQSLTRIKESYQNLYAYLNSLFYIGNGNIITTFDLPLINKPISVENFNLEYLTLALKSGNQKELDLILENLFQQLNKPEYDVAQIRAYTIQVYVSIIQQAELQG